MIRRTAALVLVLLGLFALTGVPADAGGPTSVILSAPPHVVAFGYDDAQYAELQNVTEGAPGGPGGDHRSGRFVRAAWLIHDMSVWRIDIIYPDAPGGPWILSADTLAEAGPVTPTWHRSSSPVRLVKLLGELKLLSGQFHGGPALDGGVWTGQPTQSPEPAQPAQPAPARPSPAAPAEASTTSSILKGWRWIVPGALLGAAGAILATRLFPKRRWDLID